MNGEDAAVRHWFPLFSFIMVASCQNQACPSPVWGPCNPRLADCPEGYSCGLLERCTRSCEETPECWVKVESGCRSGYYSLQRLPDGGTFQETSDEGFCPESKLMECIEGHCQLAECADGGCDYDLYGPSDFKGNQPQGPHE